MDIKEKILGLLMTRSVDRWSKIESFDREIKPYTELSKTFGKIFIFTYASEDSEHEASLPANIEIIKRPASIPATLYMFLMPFVHAKIFRQVDILKTNQMDGSWAGVIAKKLFKKKLVVRSGYEWLSYLEMTKASFWKRCVARVVESWSYKNADRILITSEEDREFIVNNFKVKKEKVEVVRNYIDTDRFKPDETMTQESGRIIFVGRLHKDKNILMLLESLKGLACKLVLVGAGSQKEEIKTFAEKLGVDVEMLGRVSQEDLPKELQKSEIFVLPSRSEGNPKALLEAMSSGLACVGTDVKGIKEIIDDNESGFLAEVSPDSLQDKIKVLLENKSLRDKLGSSARAKIVRDYSLPSILAKELEIYKNL